MGQKWDSVTHPCARNNARSRCRAPRKKSRKFLERCAARVSLNAEKSLCSSRVAFPSSSSPSVSVAPACPAFSSKIPRGTGQFSTRKNLEVDGPRRVRFDRQARKIFLRSSCARCVFLSFPHAITLAGGGGGGQGVESRALRIYNHLSLGRRREKEEGTSEPTGFYLTHLIEPEESSRLDLDPRVEFYSYVSFPNVISAALYGRGSPLLVIAVPNPSVRSATMMDTTYLLSLQIIYYPEHARRSFPICSEKNVAQRFLRLSVSRTVACCFR